MKKPKPKKPKIPKGSLIVDYGLKRVILPYKYPLDLYNNKELLIISEWCKKTFPIDSWRVHNADNISKSEFFKDNVFALLNAKYL